METRCAQPPTALPVSASTSVWIARALISLIITLGHGSGWLLAQAPLPPQRPTTGTVSDEGCDGKLAGDCVDATDYATGVIALSTERGNITFKPGLRLQARYAYDSQESNNDFLIRRFRLKAGGNVFDVARYGAELKIDSTSRFEADPEATVENAWLDFTLIPESTFLRVGLYDLPFSRNALTSDSKLVLMDRTLIKGALTARGLADNGVGLLFHGRPLGGHLEYAVGIFDNVAFEKVGAAGTRESDRLMPAGRMVFNVLLPAEGATPKPEGYADYRESYVGGGRRLAVGANVAQLGSAIDGAGEFDLEAWGVDLFYNAGPYVFQAEYDRFTERRVGPDTRGDGWYAQAGYLLNHGRYADGRSRHALELASRYQVLDADSNVVDDELRWISVGLNWYIREHNFKVQADYTFKSERGIHVDNDVFQIQLQLDY